MSTTRPSMTTLQPEPARLARATTLTVTAAPGRARILGRTPGHPSTPCLRPMVLDAGPDHATIALVPDGALLLAGDRIELRVEVGPGVQLTLVEPSGTVAYDMRGGSAEWSVELVVGESATLLWAGEPFVVAAGSRVRRRTTVRLADGAAIGVREWLVLGRHGERAGWIAQEWHAYGPDGAPVLIEELVLDETAHRPGILGGYRVLGSVFTSGLSIPGDVVPSGRMNLEGGATLWRTLSAHAHQAECRDAWQAVLTASGG